MSMIGLVDPLFVVINRILNVANTANTGTYAGANQTWKFYTELNVLRDYTYLSINYCSIFSSAPLRSVL